MHAEHAEHAHGVDGGEVDTHHVQGERNRVQAEWDILRRDLVDLDHMVDKILDQQRAFFGVSTISPKVLSTNKIATRWCAKFLLSPTYVLFSPTLHCLFHFFFVLEWHARVM